MSFLQMNLPNPGSGGFYQFIEPPSNQASCLDNVSQFLDEEKAKFLSLILKKKPKLINFCLTLNLFWLFCFYSL